MSGSAPLAGLTREERALLVERLRARKAEPLSAERIGRRPDPTVPPPLSFAQQRLWFLDQLEPGNPAYNVPIALRIQGDLDPDVLHRALEAVASRHESLRTTFRSEGSEPVQVIAPELRLALPVVDLHQAAGNLERLCAEEARRPFDLAAGPLLRALLLRLGVDEHVLQLTLHHIVTDGWSMDVLVRETVVLYRSLAAGIPSSLPELPIQYADFAVWQRGWFAGERLEAQLAWWRERLQGLTDPLPLPLDRPRPAHRTPAGGRCPFALAPVATGRLRDLAREEGATLFVVLLAGVHTLLLRYSGEDDVAVGSPVANRNRAEVGELIGFFVNTLVLRGDLAGDPAFRNLVGRTRRMALGAYDHQDLPLERLVEELQPERDASRTPLFQVLFALQNTPASSLDLGGLHLEGIPFDRGVAQFDLSLQLQEMADGGLSGIVEYSSEVFDGPTVARLAGHLASLLSAAAADPRRRLADLPLLAPAERHQMLVEWNDTRAGEGDESVVDLFRSRAARTPDAIALTGEAENLSYAELDRRSDRLARRLQRLGVGLETVVGLHAARSPEMVVALLGILKAGGVFLPLDLASPGDRLAWMLMDATAHFLLAEGEVPPEVAAGAARILALHDDGDEGPAELPGVPAEALAYVMYTSGSTGQPKGVAVTHGNIVRLVRGGGFAELGPDQTFLQLAPVSFDASTLEIWGPLANGGRLVLFPGRHAAAEELAETIERQGVTSLWLTAGLFHQMVDFGLAGLKPLRQLLAGGDALSPAHVLRAREGLPETTLINGYGPTEGTTFTCCYRMTHPGEVVTAFGSVPIGRPIGGTRVHLLDRDLQPVPVGVTGELYAGGRGLARGYLGRPDLTAERFVPDPLASEPGTRLYRTGDLARYLPDGRIEFLGRNDAQVKIRGFRVEPGEVEAALAAHPEVRQAAVLALDSAGGKRLVACIVPVSGAADGLPDRLQSALRSRLPEAMVPTGWTVLPSLPLSTNGKVDRRSLAALMDGAGLGGLRAPYIAPRTAVEETLARLWADVLGVERVGVHDSFFDLGGHSLLATQLASRVREVFRVELPLRAVFESRDLASLATAVVAAGGEAGEPLRPVPRGGPLPLSFSQERLWFLDRLSPGTATYNLPSPLLLRGPLDPAVLERCCAEVVRRHEALRTRFAVQGGEPVQVIDPPSSWTLPVIDLTAQPSEARRWITEEAGWPFDLARGPLLRTILLQLAADEHILLLTAHHIVSDGWSVGVLFRELTLLYEAFASGRPSPLPPLPVQYADFAQWQRQLLAGPRLQSQLAFWRERLAGHSGSLDLPLDRPRPAVQTNRGASIPWTLPEGLVADLRSLGVAAQASTFMVLLAGFNLLLQRLSAQDDILVGTPVASRTRPELEGLIGFFLNTLALRTDLSGRPTFRELLAQVREAALDAYAHQDVPFERLLEELQPERDLSRTPLFQVFFNMLSFPRAEARLPGGVTVEAVPLAEVDAKFDFTLYAAEADGAINLNLVYNTDLFDQVRMEEMLRQYQGILLQVAGHPDAPVDQVSLLTPEAAAVLPDPTAPLGEEWRGAVHELFAEQARRHPERPAVEDRDGIWTYGELADAVERLAGGLAASGVGRGDRVAIYAHRSAPLVLAVLGALRAGAAFSILDPAYPAARIVEMLRLAEPRAWLAVEAAGPPPAELEAFLVDHGLVRLTLPGDLAGTSEPAPQVEVQADDLALVAFTSGSTGKPKAILGRHGPLSHFLPWQCERFGLSEADRYSMLSGLAHDPLQRDIFTPLATGATVCIPHPDEIVPGRLGAWMARREVTVAHLTPALGQILTEMPEGSSLPALRRALLVGDVLTRLDVDRLRRLAPQVTCVNLYGTTETQRAVSCHVAADPAGGRHARQVLPLGRGMKDVQLLVTNAAGRLAGIGEVGEIAVRSPHLAAGYLGDEALTRDRFRVNPFTGRSSDRIYRTGDLGRYLPDGEVTFAGRADVQIKIRGFRMEPGEIEATLGRLPGVRESVVVARQEGPDPSTRRLVAYIVPEPERPPTVKVLREALAAELPAPWVPSAFVFLDRLPLTPNGKVDRRALPALEEPDLGREETFLAPRTEIERAVAEVWTSVLGLERVGVHHGFFELGGHSLLATQVVSRLYDRLGAEVSLRDFFADPTVAGLARRIEEGPPVTGGEGIPQRPPGSDTAPLSFAQQRFWFLDRLEPGNPAHHIPAVVRISGALDPALLHTALERVVARQEALRTTFRTDQGKPVQVIAPELRLELPVVDLSAGEAPGEVERICLLEIRRPFDLAAGPLLRVLLVRLGPESHVLVLTLHHIVGDAWSLGVLVRETAAFYTARTTGNVPFLPELPIRYADFALWQRKWLDGERLEVQITYWRERLRDLRILPLPLDRPRPPHRSPRGGRIPFTLGSTVAGGLRGLARQESATLFMALLAGFQALLQRATGEDDVAVGVPVANRNRSEVAELIGYFANTLVMRGDLSGDPSFRHLVGRLREVALGAYDHQDLPFERLVEELRPERDGSRTPLFQVLFALQNTPVPDLDFGDLRLEGVPLDPGTTQFDLSLRLQETPEGGLAGAFEYSADVFDAATVTRLAEHLRILLTTVAADSATALSALPLPPPPERQQLLAPPPPVRMISEDVEREPQTRAEQEIAAVWREVLGVERVSAGRSFFDLGGHSLLATQVLALLRDRLGVEIPMQAFFDDPTVAGLAGRIAGDLPEETREDNSPGTGLSGLSRSERARLVERLRAKERSSGRGERIGRRPDPMAPAPPSFGQERFWFLDRLEPGNPAYHIPTALRIRGDLDPEILRCALEAVAARHESLRTTFSQEDGRPVQVIAPDLRLDLPVVDLSADCGDPEEVGRLAAAEVRRPFDLAAGPVMRALLLRLDRDDHVLVLTLHHVVSDGWSMGVLVRETAALYRALASGEPAGLPELPIQYADFAVWQRDWLAGERMEAQLAWWRDRLQGLRDPLPLPLDRPRPLRRVPAGAYRRFALDAGVTVDLQALAQQQGATLFIVFLAGLEALLGRLSGEEDVAVGSPVANRTRTEISGLIGLFINMLVMRGDLSGDPSFRELVDRLRGVALGAYDHQDLPFERLVEELRPERDGSRTPLFQVLFALQNLPVPTLDLGGLHLEPVELSSGSTQFDLQILLMETPSGVDGAWGYRTDVFDGTTIERTCRHFATLLAAAASNPDLRLSELPILAAAERRQLVSEWNDTREDLGASTCLHQLFAAQAARTPEAPAVLWDGGALTYRELDRRATVLACQLARRGVGLGDRVAILLQPSPERVAAVLAVLRTGAAYVPLDPAYPQERLEFMIRDCGAVLLLVHEGRPALPGPALAVPCGEPADEGEAAPALFDLEALAYIIYTSGSTGRPKGVMIRHRAAANTVLDVNRRFGVGPGDRVLAVSSLGFDLSVWDLFGLLAAGGAVVLPPPTETPDPAAWAAAMARHGVTIWNSAPALLDLLLSGNGRAVLPPTLRLALLSGDWIPLGLPGQIPARVVSLGGATEVSIWSICFPIGEMNPSWVSIPYGRPMANQSFHVLDAAGEPAPIGVVGELAIGGVGVADGYFNRPELTAGKFVPDPWSELPGARLYRTGDLGRRFPNGVIEFLGRLDHQVKLRGYRIELGEIEAALMAHPGIREAVALVVSAPGGDRRLVACVVPREAPGPSASDLRAALAERLPAFMVPAGFLFLAAFPLTPNGKLDRRELARLAAAAVPEGEAGAPPRTPVEQRLAELWTEVLGIDPAVRPLSRDDNFFELGGHSLLATQLASRIREAFAVELPLREVFESPELISLAAAIGTRTGGAGVAAPTLVPVERHGSLPLSLSQERLWFLDRLTPGNAAYNIPGPLRLQGPLDEAVLERCFIEIFRRHESLRTRFEARGGVAVQVIDPPQPSALSRVDLATLPAGQRQAEAERLLREEAGWPFDLERGPLFRPILLRLDSGEHVLLLTMHHIVSDGWSLGVLFRELTLLYDAFASGRPSPLPELPLQYADFAHWQRERLAGPVLEEQLAYWRERLAGHPAALDLPLDRPRPAIQTFRGATIRMELPGALAADLRSLSLTGRASLFMVLLAAFKLLLRRLSGQDDILVGTPVAGRDRPELEGLIGFFLNTLVLRTDLSGGPSFRELLSGVRETALGAFAHQEVPFERLLEELQPERDLSRTPLFQAFFNMLNFPDTRAKLPGGLTVEPLRWGGEESKFDLTVYAADLSDGIALSLVYNADLFAAPRMEELLRQYQSILAQVATRPDDSIDRISLLTPEAAAVLPDPTAPLGEEWMGAVHELFAARARRHPERPAVEDDEGTWTYGALAEAAGRLAAYLKALSVRRGDRIAIYAHRSAPVAWAVLGTLQAGAAFVLLDPAYPAPRLVEMLRLAEPRAFLALAAAGRLAPELEVFLADSGACRLILPGGGPAGARSVVDTLPAPLEESVPAGPDDLAYVAFTSGSTGSPKGILGRHGPLSHFLPWQSERFGLGETDRYSLLSGLAHDPLQRDLFTALCLGGTVCVPSPEEITMPGRLAAWMARREITVAHLTPAMGQILTETPGGAEPPSIPSLRWTLLVGDVLTRLDVDRIRRIAPRVTCVNLYGSTETQRAVGYHVAMDAEGGSQVLPLGRGMQDVQLLVLTAAGRQAGIGEVGEICVRSPHLAAGYLGDEALTRERFPLNPFTGRPGDRIYRTGDLGRSLPDGEVVFVGRADHQVKIRGFRIELGEIEAALGRLPGVLEAVVIARQDNPDPATRRLVAYVVPDPERPAEAAGLRDALRSLLPAYMVPAAFVLLPKLPVTPNGKVDRRALPAPEGLDAGLAAAHVEPEGDLEEAIAAVWREVLGLPKVGVVHNFFDLGGHSLLLVRLHARLLETLGRELSLVDLFNYPNIRALAGHLSRQAASPEEALGEAKSRARRQIEAARRQRELARARRGRPEPS